MHVALPLHDLQAPPAADSETVPMVASSISRMSRKNCWAQIAKFVVEDFWIWGVSMLEALDYM